MWKDCHSSLDLGWIYRRERVASNQQDYWVTRNGKTGTRNQALEVVVSQCGVGLIWENKELTKFYAYVLCQIG